MQSDLADLLRTKGMRLADLARAVATHKSTVTRWARTGVPLSRVNQVSAATGIPKRDLRPDVAALMDDTQESAA